MWKFELWKLEQTIHIYKKGGELSLYKKRVLQEKPSQPYHILHVSLPFFTFFRLFDNSLFRFDFLFWLWHEFWCVSKPQFSCLFVTLHNYSTNSCWLGEPKVLFSILVKRKSLGNLVKIIWILSRHMLPRAKILLLMNQNQILGYFY
jgi:hypothetical protein